MRRVSSPTNFGCEGEFGTSGAPSPTDLWFVWFFGASGVLSPRDLGCEGVSLFRG